VSRFPLNVAFVVVALIFAASGALQCFWPEKLKMIKARLPRGYDPESPGGRLVLRLDSGKPGLLYRVSGFALLVISLLMIAFVCGYRP
jgi:hypothetical protein